VPLNFEEATMTDQNIPDDPADEQRGADGGSRGGETIGATGDAPDPALERDPDDWVSGDDPMTSAQRSYLDTLAKEAGEELPADLTKAEASKHIDRLRGARDS
jgi:hypothetical protein